jgi:DNA repair protein RadC
MARNLVRERLLMDGPRALSDTELLSMLGAGGAARRPVPELAWLSVGELRLLGISEARAAALVAAFELGRRGA